MEVPGNFGGFGRFVEDLGSERTQSIGIGILPSADWQRMLVPPGAGLFARRSHAQRKTAVLFMVKNMAAYNSNFPPMATGCVAARRAKVRRASALAVKATLAHACVLAPPSVCQARSSILRSPFTNSIGKLVALFTVEPCEFSGFG